MNPDLRFYTDFPRHPKTQLLRRRLGPDAVLALQQLWCAAAEGYPDGAFPGKSDEHLEIIAGWTGESGALLRALREIGFIDGSDGDSYIHDWLERQPWVKDRAKRSAHAQKAAEARWAKDRENAQRDELLSIARTKGTHTDREWKALIQICGRVCARCKQDRTPTKDHVVPVSERDNPQASDAIANLQPLCQPCNSEKGTAATDFRPPNWEALLREMLGACSQHAGSMPAAMPPTQPNQEESKTKGEDPEIATARQEFLEALRAFGEKKSMDRPSPKRPPGSVVEMPAAPAEVTR